MVLPSSKKYLPECKYCMEAILGYNRNTLINVMLHNLPWLTVEETIEQTSLISIYKMINGNARISSSLLIRPHIIYRNFLNLKLFLGS